MEIFLTVSSNYIFKRVIFIRPDLIGKKKKKSFFEL